MQIPLTEPSGFRYIYLNSETNHVHLLVPFIASPSLILKKSYIYDFEGKLKKYEVELKAYFEGGAVTELESYKSMLEFHISLLTEGALRQAKEARLAQVEMYLEEVIGMRNNYKAVVNGFLSKPSNTYDIQLRPSEQANTERLFTRSHICTNFANITPPISQNQSYFDIVREEAALRPKIIALEDTPTITIDIEPSALIDKLGDVQWDMLPKEVVDSCCTLPAFQVRQLVDDVAKGKQDEANAILAASTDIQKLLRASGKFTDYSGRTFNCTAYEYAWWAKDTHMRRMLEGHMDDETRTLLLDKIDEIERSGLAYLQHGLAYKNPHYDMSFVLKDLSPEAFRQLQTMVGQNNVKVQQASADNYQTIPFTATEYEALKKELIQQTVWSFMPSCSACFQFLCYLAYPVFFIASLFVTSPAEKISNNLRFDFHSLITALDTCVTNYDKWDYHERKIASFALGKAQRDVPAHIAHEYCWPDRSFDLCREFNEETLPRILTFKNYNPSWDVESWFPLSSRFSELGFDFFLLSDSGRCEARFGVGWESLALLRADLAAVSHLDKVRIGDLTLSREILEREPMRYGMQC